MSSNNQTLHSTPDPSSTEDMAYHFDQRMNIFTSRWLSLSIDMSTILFLALSMKILFNAPFNWTVVISLYFLIHILLPGTFFHGITLGRWVTRLRMHFPENASPMKKRMLFILRDSLKLFSILVTVGLILFITGLLTAENGKPALHEKISGVNVYKLANKNDVIVKDDFDGKFRL